MFFGREESPEENREGLSHWLARYTHTKHANRADTNSTRDGRNKHGTGRLPFSHSNYNTFSSHEIWRQNFFKDWEGMAFTEMGNTLGIRKQMGSFHFHTSSNRHKNGGKVLRGRHMAFYQFTMHFFSSLACCFCVRRPSRLTLDLYLLQFFFYWHTSFPRSCLY